MFMLTVRMSKLLDESSPEFPVAVKLYLPPLREGTLNAHEKKPPETPHPPEGVTTVEPSLNETELSDIENPPPLATICCPTRPNVGEVETPTIESNVVATSPS